VRDKSGRVTCPTLLSQKCRNCGKSGHTIKYCKNVTVATKKQTEKKEPKKENRLENIYAALADDEPEPILTPKKTTYLDILAKEAPAPQIGEIVNLKDLKKSTFNLVPIKLKHSWASETSSESTEYDEINHQPEFNDSDSEDERICPSIPKPIAVPYN
jgi:hypothetical protein